MYPASGSRASKEFDYVVAGAGSAGCALASRLSENPVVTVCLLEAGPKDSSPIFRIPLGVMKLMGNSRYDWGYRSAPHAHLADRVVSVPRGKALGGSGSINSMVYIRGRASDYDAWAAAGCDGWDWKSVLPYFKRSENNLNLGDDELHGDAGPLHVADLPSPHRMIESFVAAGNACGVPANRDFNGVTQEGVGAFQTTMQNGRRCSPADAYLKPAMHRSNLVVMTDTSVDRVLFDGRRATGVDAVARGTSIRIAARREVVLSAGAIGSPSILLRSGVGPADHLSDLGIDVVVDRPVGRNLHDHPAVGIHYGGGNLGYALSLATMAENVLAPLRYVLQRKGLLASNTVEAGGFARTRSDLAEPDVQFHFIPARLGHEGSAVVWGRGYYGDACVLKPRSRGKLELASTDLHDAPHIDLNLLDDEADYDTLVRGLALVRRILADPNVRTDDATELVPGANVQDESQIRDFIRSRLGTAYHPVGSCRMGAADDPRSVVDPDLKVVGIEGLRVVDASIMPEIVAGNTNAPAMMIGEVAADRIREVS